MKSRIMVLFLVLSAAFPIRLQAESCTEMAKKLQKLRREYHQYVNHPALDKADLTFEEIAARLDKIVELKNKMRKAACRKIPPRPKF